MLTTLPNLLTLSRIAAIPLVIVTFYLPPPYGPWIGCGLFAVAGFTDWLDGRLARLWKQQSELGRFLDPIADKLLVAAILFMLAALQRVSEPTIFPALVILGREILVSGLREHLGGAQGARSLLAAGQVEDRAADGRDRRAAGGRFRPDLPAGDLDRRADAVGGSGADAGHRL